MDCPVSLNGNVYGMHDWPKTELVYHRRYATREEATRDIFAYIEGFYNRTRRHSAIGYISPIEMELKAA
jgi:putative transposase